MVPHTRKVWMEIDPAQIQKVHRVTLLITLASIAFYLFFQVNKSGPFRDFNPSAEDPFDAVGSINVQVALVVGVLTYARALRLRQDPGQAGKGCLILHGNILVLAAILITLVTDAVAFGLYPPEPSSWGILLTIELVFMFGLLLLCAAGMAATLRQMPVGNLPQDLTPADSIDDLWTLVTVPVTRARAVLPPSLVEWVVHFNSDRFFRRLPWLNPRLHPWRFAAALGLLAGAGLLGAKFLEGPPPSLRAGILLAGIFLSVELATALLGFALLGGYLGIRPPLGRSSF